MSLIVSLTNHFRRWSRFGTPTILCGGAHIEGLGRSVSEAEAFPLRMKLSIAQEAVF
ncbi:hypothetical protein ACVIWV_007615 [Bradyrhizobium diazoefficiens]